jgi:hypothetical protein
MENGENRLIQFLNKWLAICVILFRDGVEDTKRNTQAVLYFESM